MSSNGNITRSALLVSCLLLGGCGADPIIGKWRSADSEGRNGEHNTMEVDEDLRGEGRLYFMLEDDFYYADFDVEATESDGGYEIEWSCVGDCAPLDFTMDCELSGDDDDNLDCDGDGVWRDYNFEWEKK